MMEWLFRIGRYRVVPGCRASHLPHLLDLQAARGQRPEQLRFGAGQVEPCSPVGALEDDDLPVVDRCDVRAWLIPDPDEDNRCGAARSAECPRLP